MHRAFNTAPRDKFGPEETILTLEFAPVSTIFFGILGEENTNTHTQTHTHTHTHTSIGIYFSYLLKKSCFQLLLFSACHLTASRSFLGEAGEFAGLLNSLRKSAGDSMEGFYEEG